MQADIPLPCIPAHWCQTWTYSSEISLRTSPVADLKYTWDRGLQRGRKMGKSSEWLYKCMCIHRHITRFSECKQKVAMLRSIPPRRDMETERASPLGLHSFRQEPCCKTWTRQNSLRTSWYRGRIQTTNKTNGVGEERQVSFISTGIKMPYSL